MNDSSTLEEEFTQTSTLSYPSDWCCSSTNKEVI
jgi:hypothetical protein